MTIAVVEIEIFAMDANGVRDENGKRGKMLHIFVQFSLVEFLKSEKNKRLLAITYQMKILSRKQKSGTVC